jgi:hypothetical protein
MFRLECNDSSVKAGDEMENSRAKNAKWVKVFLDKLFWRAQSQNYEISTSTFRLHRVVYLLMPS